MIYSVCPKCEIEYKPETVGVYVIELCHDDKDVYRIWVADLHKCPGCGNEVVPSKTVPGDPMWAEWNKTSENVEEEGKIEGWDMVKRLQDRGARVIFCRERLREDGDD